ncbi:uncharacterized protein [Haliotis asinina]|uniref:uncharacterized protein n=1 Tax=Haliotis asinina TaxID=109174 RepID=UPI003531A5E3
MAADHCCVPLCTSDARNDGSLSFHTFPKPEALRKRWKVAIRRDEGPFFTITRKSVVCSKHLKAGGLQVHTSKEDPQARICAIHISLELGKYEVEESTSHPSSTYDSTESPTSSLLDRDPHEEEEDSLSAQTQTDVSLPDTQLLLKRILELEKEKDLLKQQLTIERFGLERFNGNDDLIQYYTSFRSYKLFRQFFEFVKPSASNMCSMYYACANAISLAGSIPIWPSRVTVDKYMPPEFQITYPSTRVILDCTELRIQIPSALVLNSMFYSHYKSSCTPKGLIGIAPNGAITFVSNLYTGVMSDVEITKLSGILDLLEPGDSVMTDKGFTIASILSERGVGLNIPPFLYSSGQFTPSEVEETQSIASLRIHVERLIRRVKENHLFDSTVSLAELGSINQLWTVACITSSFQGPLIKKK